MVISSAAGGDSSAGVPGAPASCARFALGDTSAGPAGRTGIGPVVCEAVGDWEAGTTFDADVQPDHRIARPNAATTPIGMPPPQAAATRLRAEMVCPAELVMILQTKRLELHPIDPRRIVSPTNID
jgi:hypothetical protein